ncbi:RNA-binding S4 domain-containing protein [Zhihengliuella halotolerans]|uniref:Ribosome-associated protein n=1 Tax=Zhihengliuella halotolerans TaxID=370736 RepID=A0A4Q8AEG9_9MICC|nr:RNA-binding S4 domain-containing protein [Zhihengliuella halotolerans]RZU61969.1 ribosome-associated protein [Zhihengliuella halotolerans]
MTDTAPETISIRDESIRLGQLLKLANLVEDGIEAKTLIEEGHVLVNGETETRRGRQVRHGDTVTLDESTIAVSSELA